MPNTKAEESTYEWLERVEASVEQAHAALLGSERSSLPAFTAEMHSALGERFDLVATRKMIPRLATLRERLTLVRTMLRQAAAFIEGREQLETDLVLGYTPKGLERAL